MPCFGNQAINSIHFCTKEDIELLFIKFSSLQCPKMSTMTSVGPRRIRYLSKSVNRISPGGAGSYQVLGNRLDRELEDDLEMDICYHISLNVKIEHVSYGTFSS